MRRRVAKWLTESVSATDKLEQHKTEIYFNYPRLD